MNTVTQELRPVWWKISNSITVKMLSIAFLILVLLIPTGMVHSVIKDREERHKQVIAEVSSKWAREQLLLGPVLTIPYKYRWQDEDGKENSEIRMLHTLPDTLAVSGTLVPQSRNRGIYEVIVYKAELELSGSFMYPDFAQFQIPEKDIRWSDITLSVAISDIKGISEAVLMGWGTSQNPVNPGVKFSKEPVSGIHAAVHLPRKPQERSLPFDFSLNLKGSDKIEIIPVGKTTRVDLVSTWAHPSFTGEFLPDQRHVSPKGFSADWTVFHLNRNIPQTWIDEAVPMNDLGFGVRLFLPADEYQQNTRSAKYAILFIVLTFGLFFLLEVASKQRIHPFQYLLVGLALCIFYILLLSLSEHMGFPWSYLISALAVVGMVGMYARCVMPGKSWGWIVCGYVAVLYGYLYIILQLEDYAMLAGCLGLFTLLGLSMYFTRNVDWYAIEFSRAKENPEKIERVT